MMTFFRKERFAYASPWLLAAAIGLLVFIILVFTANNLRRETRMMDETLLLKGQALVRFVGAGIRASTMMGPEPARRIQELIEQAALDEDILYLALVDDQGRIVAHSNPAAVGRMVDRELTALRDIARGGGYQVRRQADESVPVFEVVSLFQPFERGRGRHRRLPESGMPAAEAAGGACEQRRPQTAAEVNPGPGSMGEWWRATAANGEAAAAHLMLVGLDMTEQAQVARQDRFQLILISLALLLVGIGGWFSLLVAQGYQVSQKTLRHIRAFAGLLISRLPVGIVATGPDGSLKTCNPAAAAIIGRKQAGATGRHPAEILPSELAAYFRDSAGGEVLEREVTVPGETGERLLEVSSVPIRDEDDAFMGRVLLLYDVTGQRRLERRLRRQERFVALGKMAAGVAHEVRNPLSSIKGFATLLGGKFPQASKEAETARLLISEVERLNRAITELLDFARPLPLQPGTLEMEKVVGDSLELVKSDARALGIEIRVDIAPGLPPLHADPDRLNQVLLNLYLNSMQAMEQGGRLTVKAGPGSESNCLEIVVEDTGRGIAPEELDRIFDPYFTTKPAGTGLGLAMVLKIVEEHGGRIQVTSAPGAGARVVLSLPAAAAGSDSAP
jgi:two-component system, NtrC family, sensor histidine kinase HydH